MDRAESRDRLLIVSDTMPPDPNGIALIAFHTAELLSQSFDVHVVGAAGARFLAPGITYTGIPRLPIGTPDLHVPRPAFGVIARAVAAADRVVVHTPGPLGLAALHYARRAGKHTTLFQHNDYPALVKYGLPRTIAAPLLERMAARIHHWSIHAATRVVAPTRSSNDARCEVLRLDPPDYPNSNGRARSEHERLTIAYHGRVSREKAVDALVRAIHAADPERRLLRLRIVGDGSQLLPTLRLASALGVLVEHVPWCTEPRRALVDAAMYVTASRTETYSITTLEAMGCGLPIIARRVGNIPGYVTDGSNGLLFDVDEQLPGLIKRLTLDDGLRHHLGESARKHATSRSIWEQFAGAAVGQ